MSRDKRGNRTQEVDGSSPDIQRCFVQKKTIQPRLCWRTRPADTKFVSEHMSETGGADYEKQN